MNLALTLNQLFINQKPSYLASEATLAASQSLVERCKAGESKAQFELYKQYAKAMYSICLRISNHETEAEDILQEAFVAAFRKINEFRNDSTFGAWLKRIVVNTAINYVRKRRMELVPMENARGLEDESDKDKHKIEEETYQIEQVKAAIRKLPDGFRVVLSLYLLEGYDHAEIAEVLGISESTSKSQYNRAKTKLREFLT